MAIATFSKQSLVNLMRMRSLKFRLILSSLLMVIVLLPLIAVTLNSAFERQLKLAIQNELKAYSYSILAVAEIEDEQLFMPEQLLENQFNVIQSGLYALITSKDEDIIQRSDARFSSNSILWQSSSFLSIPLPKNLASPIVGQSMFSVIDLEKNTHLVYSFSASFTTDDQHFPITLHIIKDQSEFLLLTQEYKQTVWAWLLVLICVFTVIQLIWLAWTIKPLTKLTQELSRVEQGQQNTLQGQYPLELEQVTQQLNILLNTEQQQRKRYRNALADLAHGLKTPLSAIQTQQELSNSSLEQLSVINNMIEHQLKRAQSAGESAWHLGFLVKPSCIKLISTLEKIYHGKNLRFNVNIDDEALFKGDEADFVEIIGNLLDNACKAAKEQITLKLASQKNTLVIIVEDDGAGVSSEIKAAIFERGVRADTYEYGHGIGLAIVRDLVESYRGVLSIEKSPDLKGAKFIVTFSPT